MHVRVEKLVSHWIVVRSCYNFGGLKQLLSTISQFLLARSSGTAELASLLRVSQGCRSSAARAAISSEGLTGEGPTSKLVQVIGQ